MHHSLTSATAGLLSLCVSVGVAGGGPAPKATGDISWIEDLHSASANGAHRQTDFNAHEAKGMRPPKGQVSMTIRSATDDTVWRFFEWDVVCVNVLEDASGAFMLAQTVTDDFPSSPNLLLGRHIVFRAEDLAEPASAGDEFWWGWADLDPRDPLDEAGIAELCSALNTSEDDPASVVTALLQLQTPVGIVQAPPPIFSTTPGVIEEGNIKVHQR